MLYNYYNQPSLLAQYSAAEPPQHNLLTGTKKPAILSNKKVTPASNLLKSRSHRQLRSISGPATIESAGSLANAANPYGENTQKSVRGNSSITIFDNTG